MHSVHKVNDESFPPLSYKSPGSSHEAEEWEDLKDISSCSSSHIIVEFSGTRCSSSYQLE